MCGIEYADLAARLADVDTDDDTPATRNRLAAAAVYAQLATAAAIGGQWSREQEPKSAGGFQV